MWRKWDKKRIRIRGKSTAITFYWMMHNSGFIAATQTAILGDAFYLSRTFLVSFSAQAPGSQPRHSKN